MISVYPGGVEVPWFLYPASQPEADGRGTGFVDRKEQKGKKQPLPRKTFSFRKKAIATESTLASLPKVPKVSKVSKVPVEDVGTASLLFLKHPDSSGSFAERKTA